MRRRPCSEFPNDNPALHDGAIWTSESLIGPAVCIPASSSMTMTEPRGETETAGISPPSAAPETSLETPHAEKDVDDIEFIDDLVFGDIVEESAPHDEPCSIAPPPSDDPYELLVAIAKDVARNAGASPESLGLLSMILGGDRLGSEATEEARRLRGQATAWQGILRGEADDFGSCGMLDEWAATLVAHVLGQDHRAVALKRDFRQRGVAAFGMAA